MLSFFVTGKVTRFNIEWAKTIKMQRLFILISFCSLNAEKKTMIKHALDLYTFSFLIYTCLIEKGRICHLHNIYAYLITVPKYLITFLYQSYKSIS